jgi:hypothetical protein
LFDEVLDGNGLMASMRIIFANAANHGLGIALIVNAKSREGLACMSFQIANWVAKLI